MRGDRENKRVATEQEREKKTVTSQCSLVHSTKLNKKEREERRRRCAYGRAPDGENDRSARGCAAKHHAFLTRVHSKKKKKRQGERKIKRNDREKEEITKRTQDTIRQDKTSA